MEEAAVLVSLSNGMICARVDVIPAHSSAHLICGTEFVIVRRRKASSLERNGWGNYIYG